MRRALKTILVVFLWFFALTGVAEASVGLGVRKLVFGATDPYTRSVAGNLTGTFYNDVVTLSGNQWVVFFTPGLHHASKIGPTPANDLAILKGAGSNPSRDGLLVCSDFCHGVELWLFDPQDLSLLPRIVVGSSLWHGAIRIHAVDADGDGFQDLVGLRANRLDLMILYADPSDGSLTTGTESVVSLGALTEEVVPIRWTPGSGSESAFALRGTSGIRVIDRFGGEHVAIGGVCAEEARFAVIEEPGSGGKGLATGVGAVAGGNKNLFTMMDPIWDAPVSLSNVELVGFASGDKNSDGFEDLILSHRSSGDLMVFFNQRVNGLQNDAFNGAWVELIPVSTAQEAAESEAIPVMADLDGDGDADVCHPIQALNELHVGRTESRDHFALAPRVSGGTFSESGTGVVLNLDLEFPPDASQDYDAVEIVVWRQEDAFAMTDKFGIHRCRVALPEASTIQLEIDDVEETSAALIHTELRLVVVDGEDPVSGEILSVSPTWNWAFTRSEVSKDAIEVLYGTVGSALEIDEVLPGGGSLASSGNPGPGGWEIPLPCVPCFEEFPDPPDDANQP